MKFLFLGGGPNNALPYELRQLGHEVYARPDTDWFHACMNHEEPAQFMQRAKIIFTREHPDVLVVTKGWHLHHESPRFAGRPWVVPPALLQHARSRKAKVVYICYDDPACTPITLQQHLPDCAHAWLTTCAGITKLFSGVKRTGAAVHEFWLGWDDRTVCRQEDLQVDVAITGSPYHKPFPAPHYQGGFSTPRRDLVRALLDAGFRVGIWGPQEWLRRDDGGDPRFAKIYRGWIDPSRIHVVHQSAPVVVATQLVEGHRYESGRLTQNGPNQCVVHEDRPGLRGEFGNAVSWFKTGDVAGAVQNVRELLERPDVRQRLRQRLTGVVLGHHCWSHRAKRLVEIVEGL